LVASGYATFLLPPRKAELPGAPSSGIALELPPDTAT